jgi:hypothetical protein
MHSFEIRPGQVGRPGTWPSWGWNRARLKKKIGEGKTRCDSVDLTRPGQKPGCNPLTFVFFFLLKRRRFDLKKN